MHKSSLQGITTAVLILLIGFATATSVHAQAVSMSVSPSIINEGFVGPGGEAVITLTLSAPSYDGTNVELGYSGTADADDYSSTATLVHIPFGQSSGTATISTDNDELIEPVEELIVDIISVGGGFEDGEQQVTITILDDDSSLPIELVSFDASANGTEIILEWETATEIDNSGFVIETSSDGQSFRHSAWTPASGSRNEPQRYRHELAAPHSGTNYLRLKQVDLDGTYSYSEVRRVEISVEDGVQLSAPYPNPAFDSATLTFVSAVSSNVSLDVFDMTGKRVQVLFAGHVDAGASREVAVVTSGLAPGIYLARLSTKSGFRTQRLTVVR